MHDLKENNDILKTNILSTSLVLFGISDKQYTMNTQGYF